MSFNSSEEPGPDAIMAEINVTPLTDIFLVLLIIFMVTSTALTQQGAPVNLPRGQGGAQAATGIVVTATAAHQLTVNGKPVQPDDLENALRNALRETTERRVVLRGDRSIPLEDAVHIMTAARAAGAAHISIATQPGAGGGQR